MFDAIPNNFGSHTRSWRESPHDMGYVYTRNVELKEVYLAMYGRLPSNYFRLDDLQILGH